MAYITLNDLRAYLGHEAAETADDRLLQRAINAAQKYIEDETNRIFEANLATRYYDWDSVDRWDKTLLHLDADLLAVTTLTNGDTAGTAITPANYWPMPRNEGPPYHAIKLKENTGIYWEFDTDCLVSVYGPWGYSTVPNGIIVEACTELAAFAYKKKDSQVFDTTAIPEAGVITIPAGIPATVTRVLEHYKRYL
jgi:hypothetical protein